MKLDLNTAALLALALAVSSSLAAPLPRPFLSEALGKVAGASSSRGRQAVREVVEEAGEASRGPYNYPIGYPHPVPGRSLVGANLYGPERPVTGFGFSGSRPPMEPAQQGLAIGEIPPHWRGQPALYNHGPGGSTPHSYHTPPGHFPSYDWKDVDPHHPDGPYMGFPAGNPPPEFRRPPTE